MNDDPILSTEENHPETAVWKEIVSRYQKPSPWRALWQIVSTIGPYAGLWYLMYLTLSVSWWLTLPLAVLARAFLVRVFIIFHDCGHGSFFKSRAANDITGFITGVLTFTPYYHWRWEHSLHHASSGDLDRRGTGDIWTMTVQEYLSFVAKIKGVPSAERRDRIQQVMRRTRIDDMASRLTSKLSKGYRQRVGLAQALIHNPDVLILDEPTAGLDPKQIIETRQLIKELAGNHTIILSTHILPEVSQTCQRVVIITKGRVVAVDTPDNLTARLRGSETMYVQVDAGGANAAAALSHIPGVTRVVEAERRDHSVSFEVESEKGRDIRRDLARTIVSSGWGLLELRPMRMSLEEIFLELTTDETQTPAAAAGEPVNA